MIKRILIANRAEIACRIIQTCKKMGIVSVAIYSDADRNSLHKNMADEAFYIGSSIASDSYLNIDKIIDIAKKANVDAVHAGYGFLSENTNFVKQLEKTGIIFIGPSAKSILDMGEKSKSKKILEKASIPMLLGYHGDRQDYDFLQKQAEKIGFPVLIKASAGGGGKGMKIVHKKEDFKIALKSAKREANAAFGNDHVLIEKYLIDPRHIEIQILGDKFGNYLTLADRDCSIQRRQQKIIEEAPAPNLSEKTKELMAKTAIKICQSINYYNAGTIEFLVDREENFYFMEMNTRLQVEHPVTEMITGLDLVELQIMVAEGKKLPISQKEIKIKGHAIESRIYAEDTNNDFLPASGKIHMLKWPEYQDKYNIRIDTGVKSGDVITPFYDPMIAKIITYAKDRNIACHYMTKALSNTYIAGIKNNISFLRSIIRYNDFKGNNPKYISTQFIDKLKSDISKQEENKVTDTAIFIATVGIFTNEFENSNFPYKENFAGWQINNLKNTSRTYQLNNDIVKCYTDFKSIKLTLNNKKTVNIPYPKNISLDSFECYIANKKYTATTSIYNNKLYLFLKNGQHIIFNLKDSEAPVFENNKTSGVLRAPMTGKIIAINVKKGDNVKKGEPVIIMEAMKMEHTIYAPISGTIANVNVKTDIQIDEGMVLTHIEK